MCGASIDNLIIPGYPRNIEAFHTYVKMVLAKPENTNVRKQFDLTGKVAAVTGGTRGIGVEVARGLAEAGADVSSLPPLVFLTYVYFLSLPDRDYIHVLKGC